MVRAERSWPEGHKSRCRAEDRGATFPLTNILAFPKAFSADVVANVLDKLRLDGIRKASEKVIGKAERNKAFRDGSYSALRCVASVNRFLPTIVIAQTV
jgi:hypothetical protein